MTSKEHVRTAKTPAKDAKKAQHIIRPSISNASLLRVPEDAREGYQERIETGVEWNVIEAGALHHRKSSTKDVPTVTFTEALEKKISKSILSMFLNENGRLTMQELWDFYLPLIVWDTEKFATDEGMICFQAHNSITDDITKLIKTACIAGDREKLRKMLYEVKVLRVIDAKMTELDVGLNRYTHLTTLNLCGNRLKSLNCHNLPIGLRVLELQNNFIDETSLKTFIANLPQHLLYLGLSRNLLKGDGLDSILVRLPVSINVLDLSHNDIYYILPILDALVTLPQLTGLLLTGNPCALSYAYARAVLMKLPRLQSLDSREIISSDRIVDSELQNEDLLFTYMSFTAIRVISVPQPSKPEKGQTSTFHVELELPLLDSARRNFLMYRNNESLTEMMLHAEDGLSTTSPYEGSADLLNEQSDIFTHLEPKNSREVLHYTVFETNRVQWNKILNFQEPAVRIFCPDLKALRDTFRSTITLRLVYTLLTVKGKPEKKSQMNIKSPPPEQRKVLAKVKCSLNQPDWSQPHQHFHWDESLNSEDAIHWGDGDLTLVQYSSPVQDKQVKGKADVAKLQLPTQITCHFDFSIETNKS